MNRRALIALSPAERREYIRVATTIVLATSGKDGYPHAVAMWFVADDEGRIWMTTYRKSQKVVNIRRDPKVALHVESGVTYDTLKGVLIRGAAELIEDEEICLRTLVGIQEKMLGSLGDEAKEVMRQQARKRIVIRVTPRRTSSWDHAKLGGTY
jgi:PPOX class probable F420-dependent enzyme